jgi:hypothetical protein
VANQHREEDTILMHVTHERLISILEAHGGWSADSSPRENINVSFKEDNRVFKETITYDTADGGTLALDISPEGEVLGLEII